MRALWILLLGVMLLTCGILTYWAFDIDKLSGVEHYPTSPMVRTLLESGLNQASFRLVSGGGEVWLPGAERPWKWGGKEILVTRKDGIFRIGGFDHSTEWMDLKPDEKMFEYMDGEFPGHVRLLATGKEQFQIVHYIELEPYIARVVDAEMKYTWSLETLKAQAIAARTFALYHMQQRKGRAFDMYANSRSMAFRRQRPSGEAILAVKETLSLVMLFKNQLFPAYFLSTCGGSTDSVGLSFRFHDIPPLSGVVCGHCSDSPHYRWKATLSLEEVSRAIKKFLKGHDPSGLKISIAERVKDRVINLRVECTDGSRHIISASQLRSALQSEREVEDLRSLHFDLEQDGGKLRFVGKGWGWHGTGLCQYGARVLGRRLTCSEILGYYYPESVLSSAYMAGPLESSP